MAALSQSPVPPQPELCHPAYLWLSLAPQPPTAAPAAASRQPLSAAPAAATATRRSGRLLVGQPHPPACATATSTGVSLNVFGSLRSPATAFDLLQGATSTCAGGTSVGSISVQCVTSGSVATVTLGPLNQTLAATATPSFYLGCAEPSGNRRCSSPSWSGGNRCRATSATTNCGGALTVDSLIAGAGTGTGTQTYQLGCPCTSVNCLVYVASSGLVVDPVNGVCPP